MIPDITGLILTFNGERGLEKTLRSLDFCGTLLVIDSGSTDKTLEIAHTANAKILTRDWEGTIPQFKFGFTHVETPWIITLDQDEFLSPELKSEVVDALKNPGEWRGFFCPRRSFYLDRFLRHSGWYPDYLLRVFRLDSVEIRGMLPHEEFFPSGPTKRLQGDIVHYPYANMNEHIAKINSYAQIAAKELHKKGRRSGMGRAVGHGVGKFLKQYVLKKGFLDGRAGFVLATHSFFYAFQKYLRLMELNKASGGNLSGRKVPPGPPSKDF